jgi:hypothetical protein
VSRFASIANRRERTDDVPGMSLGAYHYGKSIAEYFEEVASAEPDMRALYDGLFDPTDSIRDSIRGTLQGRQAQLRAACHYRRTAARSRAVSWNGPTEYILLPHDDIGQLYDERQASFEIQRARLGPVAAANFYPLVKGRGGEVRLWNLRPDQTTREHLGIGQSGYFYSPSLLDGLDTLTVPVRTGDCLILDGRYIHAVLGSSDVDHLERITINCFFALISSNEYVWWT